MNQDIREQLSALIDNELDRDRARFLLKRADHDVELVALWQRWHFAGEVLRGSAQDVRRDFLRGIHERLDGDAVALPSPSRHAGLLRWGSGFAVAASVALAALLLVRPETPGTTIVPGEELASEIATPATIETAPSVVVPSPYRVQDLRPPYRLDAQTVAAREAGRYGGQLQFDPGYEAYWLRHQQALNDRAGEAATPWLAPLRPEATVESVTTH